MCAVELSEDTLLGRVCARMVESGLITKEQLEAAHDWAIKTDKPLKEIIAGIALVGPEDMGTFLEERLDVPRVDLMSYSPEPEALRALPADVAKKHGILPLFEIEGILTVVLANPLDVFDLDTLSKEVGWSLEPALADGGDIVQAIEQSYDGLDEPAEPAIDIDTQPLADLAGVAAAPVGADLDELDDLPSFEVPSPAAGGAIDLDALAVAEDDTVKGLIGQIVNEAAAKGASTIHIEPRKDQFYLLFRVEGKLVEIASAAKSLESRLVGELLAMARVDDRASRGIRNGRLSLVIGDRESEVGISACSTSAGQRVVISLVTKTQRPKPLAELGMYDDERMKLEFLLQQAGGLVLIGGPVHAGKTATLFACLAAMTGPGKNVFAVTEAMEYAHDSINQIVLSSDPSYSAPAVLRSLPEQDVNTIGLDEIRSVEVASLICKIAQSGTLTLGTTLARDSSAAPATLNWYGLEPVSLASALTGVVGQTAVHTICPQCRTEDTSEFAAKAMEPFGGVTTYTGQGCKSCNGTGLAGSMIVYEVMVVDDALRRAIAADKPEGDIRKVAKEAGMASMRQSGLRRAAEGLVSVGEVRRATRHGGA